MSIAPRLGASALGLSIGLLAGAAFGQAAGQPGGFVSDYPTVTRADYVLGCMASNGQTRQALEQCSCSIDRIAEILPHERYVQAETIMRTLQKGGEKVAAFRSSARHKEILADLRRAQAEADIICF